MKIKILFIISLAAFLIFLFKTNKSNPQVNLPPQKTTPKISSYIVIADTGSGDKNQIAVAKAISIHCQKNNCIQGFIAGDVFYEEGVESLNDPQFKTKFENIYKSGLPYYIAYGNHDYLGCKDCYLKYKSQSWRMPSRYYSLASSDQTDFFIIDTENYDQAQHSWLEKEIGSSKKPNKIIIGHRPLVTNETLHSGEIWGNAKLFKKLVCSSTATYISGHSHVLEYFKNIDEDCTSSQFVSGGGGAGLRKFREDPEHTFGSSSHGFLEIVETQGQPLIYKFWDTQNQLLFSNN